MTWCWCNGFSTGISRRMMKISVEKFTLSFFDGRCNPHADVGSHHVHEAEPYNGRASVDNDLRAHTVDRSNLHARHSYRTSSGGFTDVSRTIAFPDKTFSRQVIVVAWFPSPRPDVQFTVQLFLFTFWRHCTCSYTCVRAAARDCFALFSGACRSN